MHVYIKSFIPKYIIIDRSRLFPPRIISPWSLTLGHSGIWILQYSWLHWVGWVVGCVWGKGRRWCEKREVGELCVGDGGGRWGERRDVGELCVCGVKEERSFAWFYFGGVQNILEKWGYLHGDLSYAFTRGVWGHASPRIFFKMVQPYLKISQPPPVISQSILKGYQPP